MKTEIVIVETARDGVDGIEKLYAAFLRNFKRKTNVDLLYGEHWKPEYERFPWSHYIIAYHEPKFVDEVQWLINESIHL